MRCSSQIVFLSILLSVALLSAGAAAAQPAESAADVIAVGKLEKPSVKTLAGAPCVLRVSSVRKKPSSIALKEGDLMMLVGERAQKCSATGEVRVTGAVLSLGEQVTLQSVEIQPLPVPEATAAPLVTTEGPSMATLSKRLQAAELVVQGRVITVRTPSATAAGGPRRKVSEHDPQWKEAVVQVLETVKGSPHQTVVVRFPGSRDIAYRDVPKFRVGQTSTLLLSKENVVGPLIEAPGEKVFVAPTKTDVLPAAVARQLKQMLGNS